MIYTMSQQGNENNEIIIGVFGSKSIKTKLDAGSIMLRPEPGGKKAEPYSKRIGPQTKPNVTMYLWHLRENIWVYKGLAAE